MYPRGKPAWTGSKMSSSGHLALYLTAAETKALPFGWERMAAFQLMVENQRDSGLSILMREDIALLTLPVY